MINEEQDLKIRQAFSVIDAALNMIDDIIPIEIPEICASYKKINEGIIEFTQAMKDNIGKVEVNK